MAGSGKCFRSVHIFVLILCFNLVKNQEEVSVEQGRLRGKTLSSRSGRKFSAFLGIPYGQPPIGPLRFKNPVPADSWNGTFVADTDGNQCPQHDLVGLPVGDEDCLYLNVYTPKTNPIDLYPIMVYIHGGAFIRGNGRSDYVAPGYILNKDIVFVTMNYRLGVFGFLSTGDAEAPGNFGLKDQLLALRWVKKNIKAFGGDPERITLVGQSAGSVSVNLHALSDDSNGLFNQYITQSGSAMCFWAYHDISGYKKHAIQLGEYVNCPTYSSEALIKCLRGLDAYSLITTDIFTGISKDINTWLPTNEPEIEGAFLTTSPIVRMLSNNLPDYPWISGNVADEGLLVSAQLYTNETLYNLIMKDVHEFLQVLATSFIDVDNVDSLPSDVIGFYFKKLNFSDKDAVIRRITALTNDVAFLFPSIIEMHIALNRMKTPFYYYSFGYRGTTSETIKVLKSNRNVGVTHSDDLIYIFPSEDGLMSTPGNPISRSDERMIDIMTDLWTSFAYNGVPLTNYTHQMNTWKPFDQNMRYLEIGKGTDPTLVLRDNFEQYRMHFWIKELLKVAFKTITSSGDG